MDGMTTAEFEYPNLRYWIFASPETNQAVGDLQLIFRPLEPVLKVSSIEQQATLSLSAEIKVRFTAKREVRSRTSISVKIECSSQNPLSWFVDIAYRLENFFSLFLGFSCPLKRVAFPEFERTTTLNGGRANKRGKIEQLVIVRANQQQLTVALLKWLSFKKEFHSFESLVYGTVRRSKLFVETEFLALAQALEGFHRLTSTGLVTDEPTFRSIRRLLLKVIDRCCQNPALKQRLRESLEHANEISFGSRMIDLFSRISSQNLSALIGDSVEFAKQVKATRNYLTHIGGSPRKTVLTDVSDIFQANQKLHALLRLLVFLELGISENTAFEPVYRQAKKWK
jgi:ApeA N-terminal domain 1